MSDVLMQSMTLEKVNTLLTTAVWDNSKSSEIASQLCRKIKYIIMALSVFKETLALNLVDLGEDGLAYKRLYLDLLIKFINELGVPFVCQINHPDFLKALELCYKEHFELKKRIDAIITLVGCAIGFDKDNLELDDYYKFVQKIDPNFNWVSREPASDFEVTAHQALKVLKLCKEANLAFLMPARKDINRDDQILNVLKEIQALRSSTELFKPDFKPIELEFIDDILLNIDQFEKDFLSLSEKARKDLEKGLLERKPSKNTEVPKHLGSEQELHKRTYFVYNETLVPDEGESVEYKNYRYPFNELLENTLRKTICSFLNEKGGRLYIGVHDEQKKVYGLTLTAKDRDSLKLDIYQMLNDFYPTITHENFVKVYFLPVYDSKMKAIPGRVVVKIIVRPGDHDKIYSVSKKSLKCFVRKDGFCKALDSDQTVSVLKKKLLSQPGDDKINLKEFDDPVPEKLEEIKYESAGKKKIKQSQVGIQPERHYEERKSNDSPNKKVVDQGIQKNQVVNTKPPKKIAELLDNLQKNFPNLEDHGGIGFKVTGLPPNTTNEEVASIFQAFKLVGKPKVVRDKESGECAGHAFVNFDNLETGNQAMKMINDGVKLRNNPLRMVPQRKQ